MATVVPAVSNDADAPAISSPHEANECLLGTKIPMVAAFEMEALDGPLSKSGDTAITNEQGVEEISIAGRHSALQARTEAIIQNNEAALAEVFNMFDIDRSGRISLQELHRIAASVGKRLTEPELHALLHSTLGQTSKTKDVPSLLRSYEGGGGLSFKEFKKSVGLLCDIAVASHNEKERKAGGSKFIINHFTVRKVIWDFWLIFLLLYVCVMTPYRIGLNVPAKNTALALELIIDVFFIVDIFVTFRTSFVDELGDLVTDPTQIAKHYLRGYLTIDVVSSMPWDLVTPSEEPGGGSNARLFKFVRLLKLSKLGRLAKLQKFVDNFKEYSGLTQEAMNIGMALLGLCGAAHVIACAWCFSGRYGTDADNFCLSSWQSDTDLADCDISTDGKLGEYGTALYWAVTCLTTVGFGDITPTNGLEVAIASFAMIVGGSYYGYLIATLTAFFMAEDAHHKMVLEQMRNLTSYLSQFNYPRGLRRKLRAYYLHYYQNMSHFNEMKMLHQLPYALHEETSIFLTNKIFKAYPLFSGIKPSALSVFIQVLEPLSKSAGEFIVEVDQMADRMFLLQRGVVNITYGIGTVVAQFRRGQSFMEYALFESIEKHHYNAVAVTQTELYSMHSLKFTEAIDDANNIMSREGALQGVDILKQNTRHLQKLRMICGVDMLKDPEKSTGTTKSSDLLPTLMSADPKLPLTPVHLDDMGDMLQKTLEKMKQQTDKEFVEVSERCKEMIIDMQERLREHQLNTETQFRNMLLSASTK